MPQIIQRDNHILRKTAKPVLADEVGSSKIKKVIQDMITALESQDDGVAIAAPQIGHSVRIFIVSKKVFEITKKHKTLADKHLVLINPTITKLSKDKKNLEEGCLSVRYLYGKVSRSHKATVEALDADGNKFVMGASGLLAQIFQHEMDHLDGILFIDKAKNLEEVLPKSINNERK